MRGAFTSKKGFSVVAPTSTTRPSSTAGSSTSCWALLKRWTSSMNRIVPWPCSPRRRRASSMAAADLLHPRRGRRQRHEGLGGGAGQQAGERGLPGAGRPPQDDRAQPVRLDEGPQRRAGRDQVLLARRPRRASSAAGGRRAAPPPPARRRPPRRRGRRSSSAGRRQESHQGSHDPDPELRQAPRGERLGCARSGGPHPTGSSGRRSPRGCSPPRPRWRRAGRAPMANPPWGGAP